MVKFLSEQNYRCTKCGKNWAIAEEAMNCYDFHQYEAIMWSDNIDK